MCGSKEQQLGRSCLCFLSFRDPFRKRTFLVKKRTGKKDRQTGQAPQPPPKKPERVESRIDRLLKRSCRKLSKRRVPSFLSRSGETEPDPGGRAACEEVPENSTGEEGHRSFLAAETVYWKNEKSIYCPLLGAALPSLRCTEDLCRMGRNIPVGAGCATSFLASLEK